MARQTRRARPAQPAPNAPSTSVVPRPNYAAALMYAPAPLPAPSMAAATRVDVASLPAKSPQEKKAAEMAMDFNGTSLNALSFVQSTSFPGFPTLSLLAQLPEYRTMHETLADECVRMWGKVSSTGTSDPVRVAQIEAEIKKHDVRAVVRQAVVDDQRFGRSHVYFKLRNDEKGRDLPLVMKPYAVRKGSFQGLRNVEAYWVTPNFYNSIDPTAADFYKPSSWWMIGVETHATRLQTIVSRPVPDMLKPTYSFAGVSMTQLAMPYVDNWLRTRQSVSDTVKQFSVSGVKTDLAQQLLPGASTDLANRAMLLNAYRDNRNILFLDMATEEFFQVNTPLSGLDALQAQSQEQMSAVSHIPLVKLLGITPTGLNASSDGEVRVFYDYVHGYQSNVLQALMDNVLRVIQLSLDGEIDENLHWCWEPLLELTALEMADKRAKDADTDSKYMENGVLTPEQIAQKLNADPNSGYSGVVQDGSTLEETPDEDIAQITQHILDLGGGPGMPEEFAPNEIDAGAAQLEAFANGEGGAGEQFPPGNEPTDVGNAPEVDGAGFPESAQGEHRLQAEPAQPPAGAGGPDEFLTDPNAQTDPGQSSDWVDESLQSAQ